MTSRVLIIALLALSGFSSVLSAQSVVPRMPDGKPNLTGVWQGGSTRRGSWDEANSGLGVGGTGRDPTAPASPRSDPKSH